MELSRSSDIRWVVEDALKFVKREARRGNTYQGLILDPPAYGHGPNGEKWKLDECLFEMLTECSAILAPKDSFMVLNLYSNGYSAVLADTVVRSAFSGLLGKGSQGVVAGPSGAGNQSGSASPQLSYGELVLRDRFSKALPLSVFSRLVL